MSERTLPPALPMLDTASDWSRGVIRCFSRVVHERGWTVRDGDHHLNTVEVDGERAGVCITDVHDEDWICHSQVTTTNRCSASIHFSFE